MNLTPPTLEIAVDCPNFASEAAVLVDRFELCCDLHQEGWTASGALMSRFLEAVGGRAEVHALIRPRMSRVPDRLKLSDFLVDDAGLDLAIAQIEEAGCRGLQGVVIGPCTLDGRIDLVAARALSLHARDHGLEVGFHRAFDLLADRHQALGELRSLGIQRVLSSGSHGWETKEDTIAQRTQVLSALSDHANQEKSVDSQPAVQVVACGGVRAGNATVFLAATGHIHASCRRNGRPHVLQARKLREEIELGARGGGNADPKSDDRH